MKKSYYPFTHKGNPRMRHLETFALSVCLALLVGCSGASSKSYEAGSTPTEASYLSVPDNQMSHVQLYSVQPKTIERFLRLTGNVAFNSFHTTPVISPVSGPVARIVVVPGEMVQKGQPLLYVSSPEYSQLRSSYMKARDAFQVADKNYARAQDLYAHHAISEKDLLDADSTRNQAQADLQAAEQGLHILGVPSPDAILSKPPSAEIPVLAPISGQLVDQLVSAGQLLQAGTTQCFTVSDTSTVWVLANVYEGDLAYVHPGDAVTIQTDAYPEVFQGKISYMAPGLDPSTRTLQARIDVQNPGRKLKRDMYVAAKVNAGTINNTLSIPDTAVLRNAENEPFVYVAVNKNQFAQREVRIGASQGGETQVTSGLKPGEQVVTQGALFLQFANSLQQ